MSFSPVVKGLLGSRLGRRAASTIIAAYISFVDRTSRWEFIGREHADALNVEGVGVIAAFWHARLMMAVIIRQETRKRVFMLSSMHRDAEIIVDAVKGFGVEFIRGSMANPNKTFKDKKGGPALVQMIGALREGHAVGVNPDGPRGPKEVVHVGVIKLAQFSGAPILPGAFSARRGPFLKTWDRFLLPLPFNRGVFVGGAPITVPADATPEILEEKRLALEAALAEVTARADALCGRSPDRRRVE